MSGFAPHPGAAPVPRMVASQARMELRLTLRRGESVLLTLVIPVLLLVLFGTVRLVDVDLDFLVPGVVALAVMSTAFTGQAIATGYERSYGVLKRLGATPLPRSGLLAGKTIAVLAVEVLQILVLVTVALLLGWRPMGGAGGGTGAGTALAFASLVALGTAAFSGLGLLMAGTLRAEATLAAANLVYVLLLVTGGVVFPLDRFPATVRTVLDLSPLAALSSGLRAVLASAPTAGGAGAAALTLLGWAVVGLGAAALTFRWE
ncbi:MAG: ABC transporter permease [Mycobacterium leprae]